MRSLIRRFSVLSVSAGLLVLAAGIALPAGAQPSQTGSPHGISGSGESIADVPAGPATLRGRIVHSSREGAGAGLTVALFALAADGRAGVRRVQSGPTGEFEFDRISNNPATVYLIGVRYGEIPFSLRTSFAAGETEQTSVLEIYDSRAESDGIEFGAVEMRVDRGCSGARIHEAHTLRNSSEALLFVPVEERNERPPIARIPLPPGASLFDMVGTTLAESVELQADEVFFWGPLHPGTQQLRFSYSLPARDQRLDVAHAFPNGATSVRVLTFGDGPTPRGDGLAPSDPVVVGDLRYSTVASGPLTPGDEIAFSLEIANFEANASSFELRSATMWLELDDAALDVREQFELVVSGDEPLRSNSDAPLLCLPIPQNAEGIRFSGDAIALGIQPDPTGGVALHGPIPAGESSFATSYLLGHGGDGVRFEREFPTGMSLLSIYIADTGVLTETDRLHRRRPVRTSNRSYIHLEAFQIDPGETVSVDITSLPIAQPLPRVASVSFVVLAALVAGFFLTTPFRSPLEPQGESDEAPIPTTTAERASLYAAIRDLEDDFETGKVSAEDHDTMRSELRRQAGELLRVERAAAAAAAAAATADVTPEVTADATPEVTPDATVSSVSFCSDCGTRVIPDACFCSQCGTKLGNPSGSGERAG